eukprot:1847799-Alexandrium_andersonii.AAC.1
MPICGRPPRPGCNLRERPGASLIAKERVARSDLQDVVAGQGGLLATVWAFIRRRLPPRQSSSGHCADDDPLESSG